MKSVRTRIAPSPTGQDLHIGNAYTALVNSVFARKNKGKFIIRIEDTDRTRFVEGSEKRILSSLAWLGIAHDEGPDVGGPYAPYRQSDRLSVYKKYAEELIAKKHAYYCFCTPQRLEQMRKNQEANHLPPMYDGLCKTVKNSELRIKNGEPYVIRLNVPDEGTTTFHDIIRGDISFGNKLIDDQVILKSDGFPTYHLGVVVDDHLMKISHIIRGEEWISSTPKHILIYQFLGWEPPQFAHMPLLRNPDKSKLSKRKNPVWVSWYKEQGFLPEVMNDSIFAIIAEELGYMGSIAVVVMFLTLSFFMTRIAKEAPDRFGSLLVMGVNVWVTAQAFVNITAITGLIPLTGIPLPFISYGGTAIAVLLGGLGLVLNVAKKT